MRGATAGCGQCHQCANISIHTPHAGSDRILDFQEICKTISIHTPHAGSDRETLEVVKSVASFQSTLPMRGATLALIMLSPLAFNFNPHSPCGERLRHKPTGREYRYFNPHSPCGERLVTYNRHHVRGTISIHTPHAGSDGIFATKIQ